MTGTLTEWLPPPDARGPVTCDVCGCRLVAADQGWRHFPSMHHDQDARGCRPFCVHALHDRFGMVIEQASQGPAAFVA
jgi:hypothetical protein